MMRLIITGGCGFIGSAVVRHLIHRTEYHVASLDKITYAASGHALHSISSSSRHLLIREDVTDFSAMRQVLATHRPDAVMHLAAETHVDRSIDGPLPFVHTNVLGTAVLLEAVRAYWAALPSEEQAAFRFHHVSTDEVFGSLDPRDAPFTESSAYAPRSPYAASKAAADHLVRAWHHTYGLPTLISNTTNNYGPWQFPEKLIPLMIINAIQGWELPIYGDGSHRRDWLFVEDHAEALLQVLLHGRPGQTYAIGARQPRSNLEVVQAICRMLDELSPRPGGRHDSLIRFVEDRPGHDARYEVDPGWSETALGWRASHDFESGLRETVQWYLDHRPWWEAIQAERYAGRRLGRIASAAATP